MTDATSGQQIFMYSGSPITGIEFLTDQTVPRIWSSADPGRAEPATRGSAEARETPARPEPSGQEPDVTPEEREELDKAWQDLCRRHKTPKSNLAQAAEIHIERLRAERSQATGHEQVT